MNIDIWQLTVTFFWSFLKAFAYVLAVCGAIYVIAIICVLFMNYFERRL